MVGRRQLLHCPIHQGRIRSNLWYWRRHASLLDLAARVDLAYQGRTAMTEWPRVTTILKDFGLIDAGGPWFEPKHRRRGRLVDAACNLLGAGHEIETDWWSRSSGERDDDRVAHEECRPFIGAYMQARR